MATHPEQLYSEVGSEPHKLEESGSYVKTLFRMISFRPRIMSPHPRLRPTTGRSSATGQRRALHRKLATVCCESSQQTVPAVAFNSIGNALI